MSNAVQIDLFLSGYDYLLFVLLLQKSDRKRYSHVFYSTIGSRVRLYTNKSYVEQAGRVKRGVGRMCTSTCRNSWKKIHRGIIGFTSALDFYQPRGFPSLFYHFYQRLSWGFVPVDYPNHSDRFSSDWWMVSVTLARTFVGKYASVIQMIEKYEQFLK